MPQNKTEQAALYLRSSKDRSDVSIDAQRRELTKLAERKGLFIVEEFQDVVESGKDERRAGFQSLLTKLKSRSRTWKYLLILDTSRLVRGRYFAQVFKHKCKRAGVEIIFSKFPEDLDPISRVVLESVFEAMDEVHSLMSKEKGLGGMAENVQRGFRAGGRAPKGYQLVSLETGAMREGKMVAKTKLEPSEEAPIVTRFLKARVKGIPRKRASVETGLDHVPQTTLIGMEWNALTYAGHTVWNVHNEFNAGDGYKGHQKRRPRSEWIIKHDTHEAFITTEEAELLIKRLETSNHGKSRRTSAKYLLTGLLKTPDGQSWFGQGGTQYRIKPPKGQKGRYLHVEDLDGPIIKKIMNDLKSDEFIKLLMREARKQCEIAMGDPAAELRPEYVALSNQISKLMDVVSRMNDPDPALRKIEELEKRLKVLAHEIDLREKEYTATAVLRNINEKHIKQILDELETRLSEDNAESMKDTLMDMVDKIVLDPESLDCKVIYKIPVENRNKVASPRGDTRWPVFVVYQRNTAKVIDKFGESFVYRRG